MYGREGDPVDSHGIGKSCECAPFDSHCVISQVAYERNVCDMGTMS